VTLHLLRRNQYILRDPPLFPTIFRDPTHQFQKDVSIHKSWSRVSHGLESPHTLYVSILTVLGAALARPKTQSRRQTFDLFDLFFYGQQHRRSIYICVFHTLASHIPSDSLAACCDCSSFSEAAHPGTDLRGRGALSLPTLRHPPDTCSFELQTSRSPGLFGSESSFECDSPGSLAKKAKREVHPLLDLPDLVLTLLLVLAAEVVAGAETAVVGLPRP